MSKRHKYPSFISDTRANMLEREKVNQSVGQTDIKDFPVFKMPSLSGLDKDWRG